MSFRFSSANNNNNNNTAQLPPSIFDAAQPLAGCIPDAMSTSRGDYMHTFASTAFLSAASTAAFPQGHSPVAIATAQSALSDLVTSMDWSHQQEPQYSHGGTFRRATTMANTYANAERGSANQYSLSANKDKVKAGGVQKPRASAERSYTLSPGIANNRRGTSSGASSQHGDEDDEDNHDHENHITGNSSVEQQRRRRFLERNRVAASKCRQKKKMWIQDLERRADDVTMQNRSLHIAVAQLKEEVLILRNQLLAHRSCGCSTVQQFLHSDPSCSIDPNQAAVTAAAIAATAAGVFPMDSAQQQGLHSPSRQHRIVHPSAAASTLLFQAPPPPQPLLYAQPQHSSYHHHHHTSSVDMSAVPSDAVVTSSAINSFVGNIPGHS